MKILDPMEAEGRIYYPANPNQEYECFAIELGEEKDFIEQIIF